MCEVFREAGHEVVGLDTDFFAGCDFLDVIAPDQQIIKDIRRVEQADLEGFDAIVHLAALSNDPMSALNPQLTTEINFQGTVDLARKAKEAGVSRFVLSSSCSVYGIADKTVDEMSQVNPITEYAKSKWAGEQSIASLADGSFVPVLLRNATAYGLSPRMRFDLVLNNLLGWAFTTGEVRIMSDGTPWRPLVHIRDISRACLCAVEAPADRVRAEVFNVGENEQNYQVKDIANVARDVIGNCEVTYTYEHGSDSRSYRVNFDKVHRGLPGFHCEWDIQRAAVEIRDAMQRVHFTSEDMQGSKYIRLDRLKEHLAAGSLDQDLFWVRKVNAP